MVVIRFEDISLSWADPISTKLKMLCTDTVSTVQVRNLLSFVLGISFHVQQSIVSSLSHSQPRHPGSRLACFPSPL